MKDFSNYHRVIKDRADIEDKLRGGDPIWQWEMMVKQFTVDMPISIEFIKTDCADEELFWLSEIFEDIAEKTHSSEFIQCIRERAAQVENPEWRAEIQQEIEEWAVPAMDGEITTILMLPPDK